MQFREILHQAPRTSRIALITMTGGLLLGLPALLAGAPDATITVGSVPGPRDPMAEASVSGRSSPDDDSVLIVHLPLTDAGTAGRLVVLPAGSTDATVAGIEIREGNEIRALPISSVRVGPIMYMRGTPMVHLMFDAGAEAVGASAPSPQMHEGATAESPHVYAGAIAEVRLTYSGAGSGALDGRGKASTATPLLADPSGRAADRAPAAPSADPSSTRRGVYLIIAASGLAADPVSAAALEDFMAWKTRTGFDVRLVTTAETGTARDAVRAYLRDVYATWEDPPLYVLLVGDADGELNVIQTWSFGTSISDHPYACVDGDDFLPDLHIGRFSAKYPNEVVIQVNKTIGYESAPDTTGGAAWLTRALTVAGNYNSTTPVALGRWIRDELLAIDYTQVDSVYWSQSPQHPWWNGAPLIDYYVNDGRGIVTYRGWALGDIGWQPPTYQASDVRGLSNGWRMPVVFSIVCHTGNFANVDEDCFGEAWMKAGTVGQPQGGVGFIGTGEPWSHSRWNDRVMTGVFESICHTGTRALGHILVETKLAMIEQFPTEFTEEDAFADPEESVEYYMHTYNLLGDPSLEVRTAAPQILELDLPADVSAADNYLEVSVTEAGTGEAVADARVAFMRGDERIGFATTDAAGFARVGFTGGSADPIDVTVTGVNLYSAQATIGGVQEAYGLTCMQASNPALAGAVVVPGTSADLALTARNTGTTTLSGATATIAAPALVTVPDASVSFATLSPGQEAAATDQARIDLDASMEDGARLRFLMTPTVPGQGALAPSEFWLTASAPRLLCTAATEPDDGIFTQGATEDLVLTLRNDGSLAGGALSAVLSPVDPEMVAVITGTAELAEIGVGQEGDNATSPFVVAIAADVAGGQVIPFVLAVTSAAGPSLRVPVTIVVGPHDFTVPCGPDAHGYYAYDSADIDYPLQVPVYDWVECSPLYGGEGTKLVDIYDNEHAEVLALPFQFQYYGVAYDTVRVSDNGWISFDKADWYDIRNWNLPDRWGAGSIVAAFWDNLSPQFDGSDGIYAYHDMERHCLVIEWSRLPNYELIPHGQDDVITTEDYQTFEILLCDPAHYPTESGDGEMIFQYKQIVNDDYTIMYSTVGIEDHTEDVGLLYTYGNQYPSGAAPLSPGLAIKFTTEAPVFQPLVPLYFTAARASAGDWGVELRWRFEDLGVYCGLAVDRAEMTAGGCGAFARIHSEQVEGTRAGANEGEYVFRDAGASPGLGYRYRLSAIDATGRERVAGEAECGEAAASGPAVGIAGGGVTRGPAQVFFATGGVQMRELAIYDISGRRVADLTRSLNGSPVAGLVQWDGRDDRGVTLPSGLYWVRLSSVKATNIARLVVVH